MRIKRGNKTNQYRKTIKKLAQGARGTRHNSYRIANQTIIRAEQYAFRDRKNKKRDFRKLWISRISAICHEENCKYSNFIHNLKAKKVDINRKMLAELAIKNPNSIKLLIKNTCQK